MPSKQNKGQQKTGFTIIEVVLVLAIAGLIFLMVFVALPALQRSQRDTQRRNDMSRVDTSLVQYQTNNMSAGNNTTALPQGPSYWAACKDGGFNGSTASQTQTAGCTPEDNAGASSDATVAMGFVQRYMNSGTDATTNTFQDPDGVFYSMYITENYANSSAGLTVSTGGATLKANTVTEKVNGKDVTTTTGYTIGSEFNAHIIYVIPGGECSGENVVKSTSRHFAVMYRLEGAGVYCIDDQ